MNNILFNSCARFNCAQTDVSQNRITSTNKGEIYDLFMIFRWQRTPVLGLLLLKGGFSYVPHTDNVHLGLILACSHFWQCSCNSAVSLLLLLSIYNVTTRRNIENCKEDLQIGSTSHYCYLELEFV